MQKNILSSVGLLFVTMLWGLGYVVTDVALRSSTTLQITALRFIFASIFLSIIFFKHFKRLNKDVLIKGSLLGLYLFIAFYFQVEGLKYTTASKNAFITTTNIIFVPFISFFIFKEKINKFSLVGVLLSFVGISLLTINDKLTDFNLGDFLTLLCAVMLTLQIVYTGVYAKETNEPILLTIIQLVVSGILSIIAYSIFDRTPVTTISAEGIMAILYIGVIGTGLGFILQTTLQMNLTETGTAILLSFESVFGTLASVIFLGEIITQKMFLGAMLMLSAVFISQVPYIKFSIPIFNKKRKA